MGNKTPVILSADAETKEVFRGMIADTTDAIIRSYDDNTAYSGKDVYKLREDLDRLGFLPEKGTGFDETLATVEKEIMPHLLRTWSTMYMPHLHAPALTETIASELIIGTFNDSMDSWDQGPAATEIEENMIHGLVKLFGFGPDADGTFTSGGTQSNMAAIIALRDWYCKKRLNWDVKLNGLPSCYAKMRLYTSEVSHFSMEKSCHVMGLGYNSVRKLPVDSRCKIDMEKFEAMVKQDIAEGLIPFCAVATIGTTDYGSIDDVAAMRRICDKYGLLLHADASYGSGLVMSSVYKDRMGDLSLCDSV
ncbi:MAG: aspartate aminotransferase family protein, partial [Spirochaetales bacterium]|nr:aspartate aminotransferase family protein [Spirochaetales bacterium]